MARAKASGTAPCVHCGGTSLRKNGHKNGHQRWSCPDCGKSFTETYGTPLYRLRTPPEEVARVLLIVMRRGSLSAAEEITGHKYETIGQWLRRAAAHAEALTRVLVRDLCLSEVEVDAFWSFVEKKCSSPGAGPTAASQLDGSAGEGERWGCISLERTSRFAVAWAFASCEDEATPEVVRLTRERTAARAGCRWISDGRRIYRRAIRRIDRDPLHTGKRGRLRLIPAAGVGLVRAVKRRQEGRLVRVEVRSRFGEVPACRSRRSKCLFSARLSRSRRLA